MVENHTKETENPRLKYSNAVRARAIEYAIQLLTKVGCDVQQDIDDNWHTLTIFNAPDPDDIHGERLKAALGS